MELKLIAYTTVIRQNLIEETGGRWSPRFGDDDGSVLVEFAGRQCYESWSRPNPKTATNWGYIDNIIDQEHLSVLEHASVSIRYSELSRSCTHELVRHRHMSPSQLSQRYVNVKPRSFVVPPMYREGWIADWGAEDPETRVPSETQCILEDAWKRAVGDYDRLVAIHMPRLIAGGVDPHRARKMAREAARCVLPNMTPTAIVLTGNHRAWRELLVKRGSIHADAEIRELALATFDMLSGVEPALYQDFRKVTLGPDTVLEIGDAR